MTIAYPQTELWQVLQMLALAPLSFAAALCWAAWKVLDLLWSLRWPLLLIGVAWLCVAYPLLPLGLAITAVVGVVTYPRSRSPRNGGWGEREGRRDRNGVSWNSKAVATCC